ncbi:glycoside hydrolase family 47 protein [Sodiomyces alkalinus F11]|uniref:alpha-1,2-Mannosidase n=1 Tax=Sodiomyces alkalinus (strain CBS 110278 / VKM F-3762 / F11) TaxID=1314773 RepID=A0A3N2PKF4_SODAK|nr:glycoside hydrolase family 47 protein [Sodiomyces alkalinus F11]ROT34900.1 glycoside hydrolase family 47 protein [Sodiomyces alkalinus F11]
MHLRKIGISFLLAQASLSHAAPTEPSRPHQGSHLPYQTHPERTSAIKEAFRRSWTGYRNHAFPQDTLRPLSNTGANDRNGWGATAVDALSTALLMGEYGVAADILEYIPEINFDATTTVVSLFETTIRYLGGLLSGYDLLNGPYASFNFNNSHVNSLLAQAERLAGNLAVAFDTPSGVPDNDLIFDPMPRRVGSVYNHLATIGTLVLEWTRLSDLTGDYHFANVSQRAEWYLLNPDPGAEIWPGLLGTRVFIDNGTMADREGGWGGGTDSFYEYLIKMWIYDPVRFSYYKDRWVAAADSTIAHLLSRSSVQPNADWAFLSSYVDTVPVYSSGHLACFAGGNFILGGLVLGEQKYIDAGLAITDGCRRTYIMTATGLGPESFQWQDSMASVNNAQPPAEWKAFFDVAGFWITNPAYNLRPEVIESYYYAYRATGDPKYQEWAWEAFLAINKTCSIGSGFSAITDVNEPRGGRFWDFQESYFLAETLKYSYLIQADAELEVHVQADKGNGWVYNTEAHPIRVWQGSRPA